MVGIVFLLSPTKAVGIVFPFNFHSRGAKLFGCETKPVNDLYLGSVPESWL